MRLTTIFNMIVVARACFCATTVTSHVAINQRPVVGILSQEVSDSIGALFPGKKYKSYIAASYVKAMESAGARVVPIMIGRNDTYYEEITNKINGILLPGGGALFQDRNGYADAATKLYHLAAKKALPLWGTCLGFEVIAFIASGSHDVLADCLSDNAKLPLNFKPDFRTSRMFANAPQDVIDILKTEPVTSNFHHFCLTEKNLTSFGLSPDWQVLSTNVDANGLTFISAFESKVHPFYGVQFHPEKNNFEWSSHLDIPHTPEAVRIAEYFADFFVNQTRYNGNRFPSEEDEDAILIYNYNPEFTGKRGSAFTQIYLFEEEV